MPPPPCCDIACTPSPRRPRPGGKKAPYPTKFYFLDLVAQIGCDGSHERPVRLDLTSPDPNLAHRIHELAQHLKFEARRPERIDPTVGLIENPRRLQRILHVVRGIHLRGYCRPLSAA